MPLKCCVTGCTSNYKRKSDVNIDSVNVYRIQSECKGDDEKLQNWLKTNPRQNLTVTYNTVVCIKHFATPFIVVNDTATRSDGSVLTVPRRVPKLTKDAYPSLFENCPSYLSSEPPAKRREPNDMRNELERRDNVAFMDWLDKDKLSSYEQLVQHAGLRSMTPWKYMLLDDQIAFYILHVLQGVLCVKVSVAVMRDLSVNVCVCGSKVGV